MLRYLVRKGVLLLFGYVKPYHPELLVKDYEFYKASYCGVCRAMKRHTGVFSNVTLSYDSVFLALVRMLYVPDEKIAAKKSRCVAHPFKSRPMLLENEATEYTARAFAILSYYKMRDDALDEGVGKKLLIYTGTADDEDFLVVTALRKGSFKRRIAFGTRELDVLTGEHDVSTVGESAFRQGLERLSPHNDGMAGSQCLEAFQVIGQPVQQFVFKAYRTILGNGYNDGNIHVMISFEQRYYFF